MEGQFLVYPAHGGNLLQIVIHPLVADYGQQFSIGELTLVLFQDGNRNIQQTDRCRHLGLVPFADDPEVAVEAGADVVGLQLADVNVGKGCEATEYKQVADLFKSPGGERVVVDGHNLLHGQVPAVGTFELDLEISEGICEEHSRILGKIDHGAEPLNEFHGRVMVAAVDIFVEEQKILDEQDVDIFQRHVRHGILVFDKLFEPTFGQVIAPVGFVGRIHLHLLQILLVVLCEEFENGARFFSFTQVGVSDSLGRDVTINFKKRVIMSLNHHLDIIEQQIDSYGFSSPSGSFSQRYVPQFWVNFQLGVKLADGLIDGNTGNNWRFPGLFDRTSLHIEENSKSVFHNLIFQVVKLFEIVKNEEYTGQGQYIGEATDNSLPAYTVPSYRCTAATFTVGDETYDISSASLTIDNALVEAPQTYSSGLYAGQPQHGMRAVTIDFDIPYSTQIETLRSEMLETETTAEVVLTFTSSNQNYKIEVIAPNVSINSISNNVSGTGLVTASVSGEALSKGQSEPLTVRVTDKEDTAYGA